MLKFKSKNTATELEKSITSLAGYQRLQQEQVSDLLELVKVQGAMLAKLQTEMLILQLEKDNWDVFFGFLQGGEKV